jgi:hypothetical protein
MSTLNTVGQVIASALLLNGPYRPPNWGTQQQLYSITCTLPAPSGSSASTAANPQSPTTYYFDATLHVDHLFETVGTEHPVQVGPAIVDHLYNKPYEMTLEVAISDAMQSYKAGQYSGGKSKSVNAFQTFYQIALAKVPITVSTRLNTVKNMYLRLGRAAEDYRTARGFKGALYFKQIQSAQVSNPTSTSRPQTTGTTNEGTKSPTVPPAPTLGNLP